MEILIGLLCSIFVYLYIYRNAIKKQNLIDEIKKLIEMDQTLKQIIVDSMSNFEQRITKLEIEVAKIKVKAGIYAAAFSTFALVVLKIAEIIIFKKFN